MQSQSVRLVAEMAHSCGLLSDTAVLLVGDDRAGLGPWLDERGVRFESVPRLEQLRELDPASYGLVVSDRTSPDPGAEALEELRRVAVTGVILTNDANGALGEAPAGVDSTIESFFSTRGDRVMVLEDLLLALRVEPPPGAHARAEPEDGRVALLSVCLTQAAVAEAAGRRLDGALADAEELRQRVRAAEEEIEELSMKLAETLNALEAERRDHDVLRTQVRGWRSSRAWPLLVVSYNVVHAGRSLRSRWARRKARGSGDG